jgi:putative ABC transport system ATP-binding protein
LRDTHQTTILLATHDPLIATRCDSIVRLSDGRIVDIVDAATSLAPTALLQGTNSIEQ